MFKKIVEFFTGKKPESSFAHPLDAVTTPTVSAPYKLEPPAETTTLLYVPPEAVPIPYRFQPPAVEAAHTPPVAVLISPEVELQKKPRKPAVKKPAVITAPATKAPAKPRAKKTPQ
jgi:hypothetical protein